MRGVRRSGLVDVWGELGEGVGTEARGAVRFEVGDLGPEPLSRGCPRQGVLEGLSRIQLDGSGAPKERALSPGDEIVLEAEEEVVLTIGDPSAISMSINGRATRSLGAPGQGARLRITPANFRDLLNN